ncbi:ATP-binding protein [Devosia psychrophila]|uniref:histidine kinase n=1 Tax=Devosia psychrophila TaxID=728005 RepID=A0A1I1SG38_9HYPH|nr:ATP-binding protein [Devosia psychrophila]SFD45455.1 PAS domain S-box-containing protein [Devosia psychrophila]
MSRNKADAQSAQERWRTLSEVSQAIRIAKTPDELPLIVSTIIGKAMGVSRVGYGRVDDATATLYVDRDYTAPGVSTLAGATPLLEYGSFIDSLRNNESIAIADVRLDPRTSAAASALESRSARSFMNVPIISRGRLAAVLFVNHDEVRDWQEEEEQLLQLAGQGLVATFQFQAEEKARELSDERYRVLFEASNTGFCVAEVDDQATDGAGGTRIDYRVIEANSAFYEQTGFPQAILNQWLRTAAPGLEEHWYQTYGEVARTGVAARFEQGSDALGRWFDVSAFRVEDAEVAILFTDISARKAVERQLVEINEHLEETVRNRTADVTLYKQIVDSASAPICAFDTELKLIAFNQAHSDDFFRIYGYRVQIGDVFPDLFLPNQAPVIRAFMERALDGEVFSVTQEFGDPDLVKPYWEVAYSPIRDEAGVIFGAFHYANDVTKRVRAEAELAAAQEALRQSQKMEAVGQLTGGLAHDFNNIIAGISGSLEMMSTRLAQGRISDLDRYISGASTAAKRAASLTQRLLAFSRRQTLAPKATNLNTLVNGMMDLVNRSMGPEIEVETAGATGLWTTFVDAGQLENALLNLCINARDAMPDGGKLTIETSNRWMDERGSRQHALQPGQYVSLCVSDTGTGMSKEIVDRAFDPFFTTKPIGQGTGLGLSMVYGFAGQSGGAVRIYSEVGKGTMVCIYLPRRAGDAAADDAQITIGIEELPGSPSGETILLVDDEPLVRMIATEALEELGYQVIEAGEGATALKILNSDRRIDLLVTDVGLPGGMNGRQVADAARVARPDLTVMFITGYAENAVLNHGHLEQGMHVMTKPFQMDSFARRVKDLISGT